MISKILKEAKHIFQKKILPIVKKILPEINFFSYLCTQIN